MLKKNINFVMIAIACYVIVITGCRLSKTTNQPSNTFSISGKVTTSKNTGISSVTIVLTGTASVTSTTDINGEYVFTGLQNGNYTATLSKTGYSFSPNSKDVIVNNLDVSGMDFTSVSVLPPTGYTDLGGGMRGLTVSERKIVETSAAWGVLTSMSDGTIGLMYQKSEPLEEINSVNVSIEFTRSTDGGNSWEKPILVHQRLGPNGTLFDRTSDGGYIVFQSRNIALGQLPTGRIVAAFALLDYHYSKDGEPVILNEVLQSNFENKGIVYTWSDDLGVTWRNMHPLYSGPFAEASPHYRIVTLDDGTAMMSLYGSFNVEYDGNVSIPIGTRALAGVIRSRDNGETWGDVSLIMTKESPFPYEETALTVTDKNIIAFVRTEQHNIVQYTSNDAGYSWEGPANITLTGQVPGGAFELRSGNLLMTWGNRISPYGASGMFSFDGGETWDDEHQISLGWDSSGPSCGYANGVQVTDGTIFVTYYSMPSNVEYRRLWSDSVVYVVKFTEEQLMAALGYY